jgi:uncharacterized membrane protein YjjP (DUF1212 family)
MGDSLLVAGMSANDVVVRVLGITEAYGLRNVHVDVTYTSISATYYPPSGAAPVTAIRTVQMDVANYGLVQRLSHLYVDICAGLLLEPAVRRCRRLREAPLPYPQWMSTVGNAGVAAGVTLLFTTSWKIVLITFLTGCLVDRLLAALADRRVPAFFRQIAAAALITLVAAGASTAGAHGVPLFVGVDPTLVVVGGIVMLVAGAMFVSAVQDAIDEFYVTASARLLEVAMWTAGIVVGILVGLAAAQRLGVPVVISPDPVALGPIGAQYVGAAVTSAAWALFCYAHPGTIALSGAMGLLGWTGYTLSSQAGAGEVLANTAGALAIGLLATLLVRRSHIPGFGLVSAALLPLVPGLALYNGLIQLVGVTPGSGDPAKGLSTLGLAAGVGLGIAAGASLGTIIGRPVADQLRRIRHRARRRGQVIP